MCCEQPFKGFLSTCGVSTPILATREQPSFSSCPHTLLNDCRRAQKKAVIEGSSSGHLSKPSRRLVPQMAMDR